MIPNGSIAQKFKVVKLENGNYKIIGVSSGKLLTFNDSNDNSALVQLYDKGDDLKQQWKIIFNGPGFLLQNVGTGKYISLYNNGLLQSSTPLNWSLTKLSDIPNSGVKTSGLAGKVVWVDPGHGSAYNGYFDPGAVQNGLREVDTNTLFANELAAKLRDGGATVLLTRTVPDPGLTIDNRQRAYLANEANADIFISVHSNSSVYSTAVGASTHYYAPGTDDKTGLNSDPQYSVYDKRNINSIALANYINPKMVAGGGFVNRGVIGNNFAVVRESSMPAVLMEIGFLSNIGDAEKISNATIRTNIVNGIYQGIVDYFNNIY
jgi:N-acetylmuramoyl-L-alanine amidase